MNEVVREMCMFVDSLGELPFDKALPKIQEKAWKIAEENKVPPC
jgi:hypothetical protein